MTTSSSFQPGLIISDALFYDSGAMSAPEIQAFLDAKIGTCLNGNCLNVATVPYPGRPRDVSSSTGNLVCEAIPAGTFRVSELIYRAQVACGISAKVILVTLQKEQGLVLKNAPTDYALRWAMGMACPDTAPCNTAFAGLGTQIVTGTRQLKVYKAGAFARQPGNHFIGWHPNSSCGGTTVNIRNFATAALYNYTPYQPNTAALANLAGTGDSCSSYGNRNFWRFYNQWFGSTIDVPCTVSAQSEIFRQWEAEGGTGGPLGASVAPGIANGGGGALVGFYANGNIYCTPGVGAIAVLNAARDKYVELGGSTSALGLPIRARVAFSARGIDGYLQEFSRGIMLSSSSTDAFAVLHGPIRNAWGDRGGSGGVLGWPRGDQESIAIGVSQRFENGTIVVPHGQAAIVVSGPIGEYWSAGTHSASLGSPTGGPVSWSAGGVSGSLQYFQRGMVLSSSTTGTFAVLDGPIRNAWGNSGGSGGSLGWPTGDQETVSGGIRQQFERGFIIAPTGGTAAALSGEIGTYWGSGSNATRLGSPTGPPSAWSAGGVSGTLQYFQRGMVLSSSTTGTYSVLDGAMRSAWGARGGSGGPLGWPTGDQQSVSGEIRQQFQGGLLVVSGGGSGFAVNGEIGHYWAAGANRSLLGLPTSSAVTASSDDISGSSQLFERGIVLSSTSTGTYAVLNGAIRSAWTANGGISGALGWPIGEQVGVRDGLRQSFHKGSLFTLPGVAPVVVTGQIYAYSATDSNAAILGIPIAPEVLWTAGAVSGSYQVFEKGLVMSSVETGTFAVLDGPFRDTWGALGGSGGSLGWPIGDRVVDGEVTRQQFQRGTVFVPISGQPFVEFD
ncbi:MAG: hypothetical protein KIT89_07320 [Microcella sp.]|uniref:LGFP repeat-containing protein n=1 Tax=Microcella sp. TaxID=1913979 RepID=UPI0024C914CE|nr:hypothetical protein [Microcella sp.]UYN82567.1 MAG: hypothetical protein KIT89_07320 [Microcella sp.]